MIACNGGGCDTVSKQVTAISGLNNNLAGNVKVYPNPAKDRLVLEANTKNVVGFEIVDMMGRTIITSQEVISGTKEINVSQLVPGNYVMKMNMGEEVVLHRFMIQR